MIVPDASATAMLFARGDLDSRAREVIDVLRADPDWAVPEHWRTEVLSVIRGLVRGGKLGLARAERSVGWLQEVTVIVAPTGPLLARMWSLRDNLSAYDAGYVAVGEAYDATLVTADARIARAGVARCPVRVIAQG
ncbi:MAG TPA: type II toxin-antitoxin system VapC family toxin [Microbacterium sp.]|nr:type II toxin-antitoxin system VapC family toxin [Microbacterium sp.]